jgi:hypothetical protein
MQSASRSWKFQLDEEKIKAVNLLFIKELGEGKLHRPRSVNALCLNQPVTLRFLDIDYHTFFRVGPRDHRSPVNKITVAIPCLFGHRRFFGRGAIREVGFIVRKLPALKFFLDNCVRALTFKNVKMLIPTSGFATSLWTVTSSPSTFRIIPREPVHSSHSDQWTRT